MSEGLCLKAALWLLCPSRPILQYMPKGPSLSFGSPASPKGCGTQSRRRQRVSFRPQRAFSPLGIYCVVALWAKQSGRRVGGALSAFSTSLSESSPLAFSPLGIYCGFQTKKRPEGTIYAQRGVLRPQRGAQERNSETAKAFRPIKRDALWLSALWRLALSCIVPKGERSRTKGPFGFRPFFLA